MTTDNNVNMYHDDGVSHGMQGMDFGWIKLNLDRFGDAR